MVALKMISPQGCSNLHSSMLEGSLYFHLSHSHSILTQEAYVSIPYSTKHVKTDDSCTAIKEANLMLTEERLQVDEAKPSNVPSQNICSAVIENTGLNRNTKQWCIIDVENL